ncbi:hypothetical protein [Streptomyces sp. NPDC005533]|uniref:hypothetical protein n=1 Tax=Streptomyces sp. NPDC005533 TaxID=3364723 RepID=UPI0036782370
MPGRTKDLKAARAHAITGVCTRLDIEVLAGKGYQGADGTVITPIKRRHSTGLPDKHKALDKVHAALRAPVEQSP